MDRHGAVLIEVGDYLRLAAMAYVVLIAFVIGIGVVSARLFGSPRKNGPSSVPPERNAP